MFRVGDLIVHGGEGVCRVEAVGRLKFSFVGRERLYYTLAPFYRNGKIFVPVDGDVFMRPIISYEQAHVLIRQLPFLRTEVCDSRNLRLLSEHYQECLKSHSCADWLQLIKAISAKRAACSKQKRKLGAIDDRFLRQAEDMLYGEFAVVLGIDKEEVPGYIENAVAGFNQGSDYCAITQ